MWLAQIPERLVPEMSSFPSNESQSIKKSKDKPNLGMTEGQR